MCPELRRFAGIAVNPKPMADPIDLAAQPSSSDPERSDPERSDPERCSYPQCRSTQYYCQEAIAYNFDVVLYQITAGLNPRLDGDGTWTGIGTENGHLRVPQRRRDLPRRRWRSPEDPDTRGLSQEAR